MVENLTRRSPSNEPINWHHINPHAKRIHSFHILTENYEGHTFSTFEHTINSSQEIYIEKKYLYTGRQLKVDMNPVGSNHNQV